MGPRETEDAVFVHVIAAGWLAAVDAASGDLHAEVPAGSEEATAP